jgi:hypothetical protein
LNIEIIKANGDDAIIGISKYLEFIKRTGNSIFQLPVNIDDLININKWTNSFIHEGYNEFIWQTKLRFLLQNHYLP